MKIKVFKYVFFIIAIMLCLAVFSFFHLNKEMHISSPGIWIPAYCEDTLSFYNADKDINIKYTLVGEGFSARNVKPNIIPNEYLPKGAFYSFKIISDATISQISSISDEGLAIQIKNSFDTVIMLDIEIQNAKSVDIDTVSKSIEVNKGEVGIHYTGDILIAGNKLKLKLLPNKTEYFYTNPYSSMDEVVDKIDVNSKYIKANFHFTDGKLNLPALFPDIYWLASNVKVDEESFVFVKDSNISYLNPDFFRVFFQSIHNEDSITGIFLEKVLKRFNESDSFYLPLSAFIASNIYRKKGDIGLIENNFSSLLKMNRKWDELIMSNISGEKSENFPSRSNANIKIFGVPSYFYISLHIKDCQELLFLAQESGKDQYLNEFRNRILKYTKYINENQSLLWEKDQITDIDKVESMMPYYNFYLEKENRQQLQKSVYDGIVKMKDNATIESYYQVISLLLTYHSLG